MAINDVKSNIDTWILLHGDTHNVLCLEVYLGGNPFLQLPDSHVRLEH